MRRSVGINARLLASVGSLGIALGAVARSKDAPTDSAYDAFEEMAANRHPRNLPPMLMRMLWMEAMRTPDSTRCDSALAAATGTKETDAWIDG